MSDIAMHDTITLADPAESCAAAASVAGRIEALALILMTALESSRIDATHTMPAILTLIRSEARGMQQHLADAAEAIRRAPQ